jgi:hypothetical protein
MAYKTMFAKTLSCRIAGSLLAPTRAVSTLCEKEKTVKLICTFYALLLMLTGVLSLPALGQITPSDDAYTLTSSPTKNFGTATTLEVESSGATTFVRFDLSGIPSSVTGSMVAKGTLKIFIGTVTTAGSFNVDLVTSSWSEKTITANSEPTLGSAIASAIPVTTSDKDQYVLVDVTAAVVDWLNGTANDGIALVPDGTVSFALNSKETTTTSHPPELDIVLTGPQGPQGPPGPISGVTAGPGLTGGGTKGNVTVSLLTNCASGQVLQWNGSTWACSSAGSGTVTGVVAGTDLTGGGKSGNVTLNLNTAATDARYAQLGAANAFTGNQTVIASSGPAVLGQSTASTQAYGVQGVISNSTVPGGAGVSGFDGGLSENGQVIAVTTGGMGVWGDAGVGTAGVVATADATYAVAAFNTDTSAATIYGANQSNSGIAPGVHGATLSPAGTGVMGTGGRTGIFGLVFPSSNTHLQGGAPAVGVSGDSGSVGGVGVWGTADSGYAVYGLNNGPYVTGLFLNNSNSSSYALEAGTLSKHCLIDTSGDLSCSGTVTGVVQGQGDRTVRLYAVQSPENWFEDFGSATLSNGSATVQLDPNFAATVNTSVEYHVFITPKGDSEALYVTNETASGFEVHEHGGGLSNIAFDYRIVGRRKGYENVRLEDVTDKRAALAALNQQLAKKNDPATRKQREKIMHPQFHPASQAGSIQAGLARRQAAHRVVSATKH